MNKKDYFLNTHFFFSVGYSVVAINHIVDFKDKKQVK